MVQTILVLGSTGNQGSSVVKHLAKENNSGLQYDILALTRDPTSPAALSQRDLSGVQIIQGDYAKPESLFESQIDSVFMMFSGYGPNEHEEAKRLIDLCVRHDVSHVVYSAVDMGDGAPGPAINEIKRQTSTYLKSSGLAYTILNPTGFMENFHDPHMGALVKGAVLTFYDPNIRRKLIATDDIGRAAAECLTNVGKWKGMEINLAGDDLNAAEIAVLFKEVKGEKLGTVDQELPPFLQEYLGWQNKTAFAADVEECRRYFPWLKDLKTWLKEDYRG